MPEKGVSSAYEDVPKLYMDVGGAENIPTLTSGALAELVSVVLTSGKLAEVLYPSATAFRIRPPMNNNEVWKMAGEGGTGE